MAVPIIEQIARKILARLREITTANGYIQRADHVFGVEHAELLRHVADDLIERRAALLPVLEMPA